jgi:sortase (surface protein transpeptidase)
VLTLVTCNSFGAKEDRFVVVADFVESHSLGA